MSKREFPLHAGAVEVNGQAFIFIASTGTGKTTLVTYLAENGYPYISDDKVLVNIDTLNVSVDIQPVNLRPESLSVLHDYGCESTAIQNGTELNTGIFRRIVYTPKAVALRELPIGGLFFIKRSKSQNSCIEIPKAEAVQLLMQNLFSSEAVGGEQLKCAIKLAGKSKQLIYSDMRYVTGILIGDK